MAGQLLHTSGIKEALGSIQNGKLACVFLLISTAGLVCFAGFQALPQRLGFHEIQNMSLQFLLLADGALHILQCRKCIAALLVGFFAGSIQFLRRRESMLLIQHKRLAHVFQIVLFCPVDISLPLALGLLGFNVHHATELVPLLKKLADGGRIFQLRLLGISVKCREHRRLVKIIPQLAGCNGLRSVRGEIGQSASALLDSNAAPEEFFNKVLKADGIGKHPADLYAELFLVRFKFSLTNGQVLFSQHSIRSVQRTLPLLLCPILTLGHAGSAAVQQINLIQPSIVAHFHHF